VDTGRPQRLLLDDDTEVTWDQVLQSTADQLTIAGSSTEKQ
jgi:hypothetical protein